MLLARTQKRADGLVVAKLDRLSRSMLDFAAVMAKAQKQGWALVALDCAVDTTTPAGEAMAHVLATFARAAADRRADPRGARREEARRRKTRPSAHNASERPAENPRHARTRADVAGDRRCVERKACRRRRSPALSWHASTVRAVLTADSGGS